MTDTPKTNAARTDAIQSAGAPAQIGVGRILFPAAGLVEDIGRLYNKLTGKGDTGPEEPAQPARRAFFAQAARNTAGAAAAVVETAVDIAKTAMDAAEKTPLTEGAKNAKTPAEDAGVSRRSILRMGRK